jgi:hypothetical protein
MMSLIRKLKKKLRVKNQATKCQKVRTRAKQVLGVGGWEDVTVGDDARGEMLPNKATGPSRRQESTWRAKTHRKNISEKNCNR